MIPRNLGLRSSVQTGERGPSGRGVPDIQDVSGQLTARLTYSSGSAYLAAPRTTVAGTLASPGDVAQLARAPALQAGGRGFESHRLHTIVSTEKVLLTALRSLQSMRRRVVVTFT